MCCATKDFVKNSQLVLLLLICSIHLVSLHPTSCVEDTQCPSGYYCEIGAHYCRECIRCGDLKREAPAHKRDACVKSVVDCGPCFTGLVQEYGDLGGGSCAPGSPGGLLPPYAWAAIAVGLVLLVLILFIFVKMNTFKILYTTRTSVPLRPPPAHLGQPDPRPPPYNYVGVDQPPSSPPPDDVDLECKLSDLSHPCSPSPERPAEAMTRMREQADCQSARVFNNPSYARLPQNISRSETPEFPVPAFDESESRDMSIMSVDGPRTDDAIEPVNNSPSHFHDDEDKSEENSTAPLLKKICAVDEVEENNNNNFPEEPTPCARPSGSSQSCSSVMTGPSFVINVVENFNNIQQNNKRSVSDFKPILTGMHRFT